MSSESRAVICLNPAQSRRLIARGVAALDEVQQARRKGRIIVALGSTNAYVAEELGRKVDPTRFMAGYVGPGGFGVAPHRLEPVVMVDGEFTDRSWEQVLDEFEAGDVFIKGANAIDQWGYAGVLLGSSTGGTIGRALATIQARGAHLVVPAGLEKLIPSVIDAAQELGLGRVDRGRAVGMMPLVNATVVTEIEALEVLAGVDAIHCASGGVGGGEGSVALVVVGSPEQVDSALGLVEAIDDKPPVTAPGM